MKIRKKQREGKKLALRVTQLGKSNVTFIIKNPKKFAFYRKIAEAETMVIKTIIEEIYI